MQHFYPERDPGFSIRNHFKGQYEGLKAQHEADLEAVEQCMDKCNFNFKDTTSGAAENACLKQCFIKFFDSALLCDKEMSRYTQGAPIG